MPRDHKDPRPAPRSAREVEAVLARAPAAPAKLRPLRVVLVAGPASHPVARNFGRLKLVDESYWELTGELPPERVLATQEEAGSPRPLFWTVEPGKGRVFVSIPGHSSWTFDDPLFRLLLLRGVAWAAKEPVDRFNPLVWPGADFTK